MRVEQAVVSAPSLPACAFVLSLNPCSREGRVLCSAERGWNTPVLTVGHRILVEGQAGAWGRHSTGLDSLCSAQGSL